MGARFQGGPAAWFKGLTQNFLRMQDAFIPNYADKYARRRERVAAEQPVREPRATPPTAQERQRAQAALDLIRQQLPQLRTERTKSP